MTRINCVPVEELSGPHLVAEYRELPRVFALAEKAAARGTFVQPAAYTLGKGHVLFFYTRLQFLAKRHQALVAEMRRRGYKPTYPGITRADFPAIPDAFWGDWEPTEQALAINRQRIRERSG
ncbi:endonuclease [Lampropedia cohaerens]|uniref:Endonuclease n=1 Tax=Lampropedia cohaerens TaxID=1610491 RepID=A0A0U1PY54_9BURK|nr:pyrimidine dimer DNA glycosylase/endonuclease V [Lampropedia cohaerens]KKW67401.1 endonuclease [Lampropedia cohaerens]